jgi:atypical dual specificity phosphatase
MNPSRKSRLASRQPIASLILPRLYLSDFTTAHDADQLERLGITHIVSLLQAAPTYPPSMAHIRKLHIAINDDSTEDILKHLPITTEFIRNALEENPDTKVLVCGL